MTKKKFKLKMVKPLREGLIKGNIKFIKGLKLAPPPPLKEE